jgi:DNA-binding response OmpR family regulator
MSLRVLLVEDDPDIQLIARMSLRKAGFTVRAVDNGEDAIVEAGRDAPDVVLLDWMMPGLDGPATCERLKADPATASIPVIFLTAKSQQSEISRGLALGARGYITKPFDALALGRQVQDLLRDRP